MEELLQGLAQELREIVLDIKKEIVVKKGGYGHVFDDNAPRTISKKQGRNTPMIDTGAMLDSLIANISIDNESISITLRSPKEYSSYAQKENKGWNFLDFTNDEIKEIVVRAQNWINKQ